MEWNVGGFQGVELALFAGIGDGEVGGVFEEHRFYLRQALGVHMPEIDAVDVVEGERGTLVRCMRNAPLDSVPSLIRPIG